MSKSVPVPAEQAPCLGLRADLLFVVALCLAAASTLPPVLGWLTEPSQVLPSPYYTGGIQYYPPGPEFKLAREAAYLEELRDARSPVEISDRPADSLVDCPD